MSPKGVGKKKSKEKKVKIKEQDPHDIEIQKLWKEYKKNGSNEIKDKLIINYAPIVKYVAGRVSINLPSNIDMSDLISYGMFGLIDAIDKFDMKREIKFETYSITRIKGAIVDELRSLDWVPRSVRHLGRELEKCYQEFQNKNRRAPSEKELAEVMDLPIEKLHELFNKLSNSSVLALEEMKIFDGSSDGLPLMNIVQNKKGEDPSEMFDSRELRKTLSETIKKLPEREKIIVTLYYYEGLTLKEIGEVLGITESRVSQLRTKATISLKSDLKNVKMLF